MTITHIRIVRHLLFGLLVASTAYVGYFLWNGVRERKPSGVDLLDEPQAVTSRQVELEQLDSEGGTAWSLTAAESVGRTESGQQFRDVEIHFDAGADETPIVVTADFCEIGKQNAAHLEGNVVVVDDTTVRLEADSLEFRRFPDRVWSTEPVRYSKKGLSGTAGNMSYIIKRGHLDFGEGVEMTLSGNDEEPTHIRSVSASMRRNRHFVRYIDDVRVRQGNRRLRGNDLKLFFDESNDELKRLEALEDVVLSMQVAESDVGTTENEEDSASLTNEPGLKRLESERVEMLFRPGGETLERVRALDGGRLTLKPPEGSRKGLHKTLEGHLLAFEFNDSGELTKLRGRGGVTLTLTPAAGGPEEKKIVRARELVSDFDPVTGDLVEARCSRAVEFEQGDVRASSDRGLYRASDARLVLTGAPRLWDPRASVEAERIEIDVDSGDIEAFENVRSASLDEAGGAALFPSSKNEPVYFVAEHLAYDRALDLAVYTGAARGFQGPNRVEGETIRLFQSTGDLVAEGGVRTVLVQELPEGEAPGDPTVTRAATLHYRASEERLEYRGEVQMRSEEMRLDGESVDVVLLEGGGGVAELLAEGEVRIETADGRAAGDVARYLPDEKSMTVRGPEAWLENAGKLTEGKQLTFFLADDKIFVDGQEQTRTKTTYTSKPRPF